MASPTPTPASAPGGGAVFLSYAREDIDAARRIAGALISHGVEVWFDQSELVGGDQWDAKIRGQIGSCALFVPVISANTQARLEGYFRIEWKLAAQRTHAMAEAKSFLLPVVIDATRDAEAHVPAEFRAVQWTRLLGGEVTPAFGARVKNLLGLEVAPIPQSPDRRIERPEALEVGQRPSAPEVGRALRARPWLPYVATLGALLLVIAGVVLSRRNESAARRSAPPTSEKSTAPAPAAQPPLDLANAKSIAVLPFENRSDDKANAYFTDGIHEDILTNLAHISELRVISRTSVMEYRGTTKKMPEIGRELNVAWLLEGSVQRAGNMVHITSQLINARTDEHRWARSFDRELTTANLFAIQAELAQAIAAELKTALSPEEKKLVEHVPTQNLAACDLYFKARALRYELGPVPSERQRAQIVAFLKNAVQLDPNFAGAWAALVSVHSVDFGRGVRSAEVLAQAKAALAVANRLAPDSSEVILARGGYLYYCLLDYAAAAAEYAKLLRLNSNDPELHYLNGLNQRRQGKWTGALTSFRKSVELDPRYLAGWVDLAQTALMGRRYDEALAAWRRAMALQPEELRHQWQVAWVSFLARGSAQAIEEWLAGLPPAEAPAMRKTWSALRGDYAEVLRLDAVIEAASPERIQIRARQALDTAIVLAIQGNPNGVRNRIAGVVLELKDQLQHDPDYARLWAVLGKLEAVAGDNEAAVRSAQKAVELVPESLDASDGAEFSADLAFVRAWTGDKNRAIADLARLIRAPFRFSTSYSLLNVYWMKLDPAFFPLRGDPRFEALLNDPKNNAPLF